MAKPDNSAEAHLPLPPAIFHMLLELFDGERHGYALKRAILKRTNGVIDFHGDWCAATDAAASANCFDALAVNGGFAASSVAINN